MSLILKNPTVIKKNNTGQDNKIACDSSSCRVVRSYPLTSGCTAWESFGSSIKSIVPEHPTVNPIQVGKSIIPIVQTVVSEPMVKETDFEDEVLDFYAKEGKKFILCKQEENGLWRIRACKDFGDVKKGDFGGLVESEDNLSQYGECWIYEGAKIIGKRKVFGTQKIVPDENNMA